MRGAYVVLLALSTAGCVEQHPNWVAGVATTSGVTTSGATGSGSTGTTATSTSGSTGSTTMASACGNGVIDGIDACDGQDLGDETCVGLGFQGGELACDQGCEFDRSACYLQTTLNTTDFEDYQEGMWIYFPLDYIGITPGVIQVFVPADTTSLSLKVAPSDNKDGYDAVLLDGLDELASCAAGNGETCDLGADIDVTGHADRTLTIQIDAANQVAGAIVDIRGNTAGLDRSLMATGTFEFECYDAEYVLFPVGPATGPLAYEFAHGIADGGTMAIGVMDAAGIAVNETDVPQADVGLWPTTGTPTGWYMFGISNCDPSTVGQSWSFSAGPAAGG